MPVTALLLCSNKKVGHFLQAYLLIFVRDLRSGVIPACFTSSNCVHCKVSFLKEHLQNCTSQALTLIILSSRNIDTDVLLVLVLRACRWCFRLSIPQSHASIWRHANSVTL